MKKKLLFIASIFVGGLLNVNAQCTVSLNRDKTKFCSNDKVSLKATSSSSKTIADNSTTVSVFDLSKDKNPLISTIATNIKDPFKFAFVKDTPIPIDSVPGEIKLQLPNGLQLTNTVISSGKIDITIKTTLKQDLTIIFKLPYFIKDKKPLIDTIKIGNSTSTITKTFDLANTTIDFSAGKPANFNTVKYVITPTITITTQDFTGLETCDLTLNLNGLNYTENTTFAWYKDEQLIANQTNAILDVNETGKYKVKTTSSTTNCIAQDTISIKVVQLPVKDVTKTGNLTFCEGNSATLSAVAKGTGYKYTWSDKSTDNSLIVKKTGSYTVTVTNDICSITSDPIAVTVNPNPIVKLNQKIDTTIVVGSQLVLRASGAKEYLWSTNSKLDSIVVKDSNNYIVTGKNEFGCTSTASVKIKLREKKAGLAENTINFSISPNPATSFLKIDLAETNATSINASIYDLSGKLVVKTEVSTAKSVLNIESLDKGMYVLVLEDQANTTLNSARFVVE